MARIIQSNFYVTLFDLILLGSNEFKNDAGGTTADSTFGAIWSDASHNQTVWCDFAGGSANNGTACMVYKRGSGGGILGFSSEM